MLKKILTYSFIVVLSLLFFYAACGYNVIKYCCASCENEGVEVLVSGHCADVSQQSCCGTEESHQGTSSESCAIGFTSSHSACQLVHLKVDEAVFQPVSSSKLLQHFSSLLYDVWQELFYTDSFSFFIAAAPPPDKFLLLSGQKILSLICVLRR